MRWNSMARALWTSALSGLSASARSSFSFAIASSP